MRISCAFGPIPGSKNTESPNLPPGGYRLTKGPDMAAKTPGRSRKIQIHLSDSLNHRLSTAARESGVTKSAFVRVALEREFALEEKLALECVNKPAPRKADDRGDKKQPRLFKV